MEESLIVVNPTNDLPELPCAQQEAEMMARLLGVTPLVGRLVTRSEVVSRLPSAPMDDACFWRRKKNGVTDPTKKISCLTVEHVSRLNVTADMVVFSACHTARGKLISIEGVLGLARVFLMAGAKSGYSSVGHS
ncbi:Hypothetical predicted protein [Paramuricea clavata]|uniref:CHAT domain-containing protein n=1 Tax=Paramuricea clavata TaxID=317549 RepID=A0A6S7H060_PARCT|nr:Hypothetical predicted protein [Paramuricea clavata]